jgi:hypothetical protein
VKIIFAFLACMLALQESCQTNHSRQVVSQSYRATPIHRFEVVTHDPNLAFDTQTGQLCRTWDWQPTTPQAKPNSQGVAPQTTLGEFAPTCPSLYKQYPTTSVSKPGDRQSQPQ